MNNREKNELSVILLNVKMVKNKKGDFLAWDPKKITPTLRSELIEQGFKITDKWVSSGVDMTGVCVKISW